MLPDLGGASSLMLTWPHEAVRIEARKRAHRQHRWSISGGGLDGMTPGHSSQHDDALQKSAMSSRLRMTTSVHDKA